MKESATIEFRDAETSDEAVVIVKYDDTEVALTVSLRSNGDIEVYMAKDVARKILAALARAVE